MGNKTKKKIEAKSFFLNATLNANGRAKTQTHIQDFF